MVYINSRQKSSGCHKGNLAICTSVIAMRRNAKAEVEKPIDSSLFATCRSVSQHFGRPPLNTRIRSLASGCDRGPTRCPCEPKSQYSQCIDGILPGGDRGRGCAKPFYRRMEARFIEKQDARRDEGREQGRQPVRLRLWRGR